MGPVYYLLSILSQLLPADQAAGELAQNYVGIPQEVEKAVAIEGKYQKVDLPYTGKSNASDIIVFMNMLPQEWAASG